MLIRAYRPADLDALVDLINAAEAVDRAGRGTSRAEMEVELGHPCMQPERDVQLATAGDGRVVGWTGFTLGPSSDDLVAWARGTVHPEFRRRGIGRALLAAAMYAAGAHAREIAPAGGVVYFDAGCDVGQQGPPQLFAALGMTLVRHFLDMLYPSLDVLPELNIPAGVELCTWTPDLDAGVLDTRNEGFRDHWGSHELLPEEFVHNFKGSDFAPELWWCAVVPGADGAREVVGISLARVDAARNARSGRREGHIRQVAVRRAWRGRGIASALVIASLRALRAAGMDSARLGVDADSLTGAQHLYTRLGFRERRRRATYRKRIL